MTVSLYTLTFCAGLAALSWELLWQHYATLAIGVSAEGTAITLAAVMGGMAVGSLVCGFALSRRKFRRPLWIYALLEVTIGISGQLLAPGFAALAQVDADIYQAVPGWAPIIQIVGIVITLGIPSLAMGATIPVLGLVAASFGKSLARLYACNTAGAACGVVFLAFVFLPHLGVSVTATLVSAINLMVAAVAFLFPEGASRTLLAEERQDGGSTFSGPSAFAFPVACGIAMATGFAAFALEVAWFRSIRAAFTSTTDTFAIVLFAVLISLALGARMVPFFQRRGVSMPAILAVAGCGVILVTPVVERFDYLAWFTGNYWLRTMGWFALSTAVMGPPILLLGVSLPWLLDAAQTPRHWAWLYSCNTLGAILGSVLAAWWLLPMIGFARTAWVGEPPYRPGRRRADPGGAPPLSAGTLPCRLGLLATP